MHAECVAKTDRQTLWLSLRYGSPVVAIVQ